MAKKDIPTKILEAAKELFFKHGFKRISIEDICNHAEVSRRTFYVYYENKTDLLIKLFEYIYEADLKNIRAISDSNLPFSKKLIQITNYHISQFEQMTPELLADIHDPCFEEIRAQHDSKKECWQAWTRNFFATAQQGGEIRADLDIEFLQRFMNFAISSFRNEEIRKRYPDTILLMRKVADMLFYGILGHEI
jgi:AcrR family transcriptional regulator